MRSASDRFAVVKHVHVGPDVAELPDAVAEPADERDQDREPADPEIEQPAVLLALAAGRRSGRDDRKLGKLNWPLPVLSVVRSFTFRVPPIARDRPRKTSCRPSMGAVLRTN